MGRLYKRPDSKVWWMAFNYDGQEIRQSTGTAVKKQARLVLDERCGDVRDANYVEKQEDVTFHDLKEWILEDYRDNGLRSIDTLQHNLKQLERFFGCYHATKITVDRVNVYRSKMLGEGLSKATINRHVAALSRMFTLGVKRQRLRHKPKFEMYEEDNARQGFLSHAEFQVLYPHLDDWLKNPVEFLYLSGWRKGEMRSLEWRDVDLREGRITLRRENSKNKRPRVLPLSGRLLEIIQEQHEKRRDLTCPYVFTKDGHQIGDFRKTWYRACKAANCPSLLVHDFRRSAVKNLIRANVPEKVAMEITGHRTRSVFDRYHIVDEADMRAALEQTQALLNSDNSDPKVTGIR